MKVAIDTGPLTSGHSIRGIGVHTRELINTFRKNKDRNIKVEAVNFSESDLSKYDIAHYTSFRPYNWTIPLSKVCQKMILTIHDLIPLIYPKAYPSGVKGKLRFEIQKLVLANFDAIVTISETSKKDICRFLPVQPNKVYVTYLAPKQIFKKLNSSADQMSKTVGKYKLPKDFVLYISVVFIEYVSSQRFTFNFNSYPVLC